MTMFDKSTFDTYRNAFLNCRLTESAMPRSDTGKIIDDNVSYNRVQLLLKTPEMEEAHGFLYDIDFDHLTDSIVQKINDLYELAVNKGFIEDEEIKKVEENPTFSDDPLTHDGYDGEKPEEKAPFMGDDSLDSAYTCLYTAMKDGEMKTGECYSNAKNPQSAKADAISKLANLGFTSIEIVAVEAGNPDAVGTSSAVSDYEHSEDHTFSPEKVTIDQKTEEKTITEDMSDGSREVFHIEVSSEDEDGDREPLTAMKYAKSYYDEDEAIRDAMKAYDEYKTPDEKIVVEIIGNEKEMPSGDIYGDNPMVIYYVEDGILKDMSGEKVEYKEEEKEEITSGPWFVNGELVRKIPDECVKDCTVPGRDASDACDYWVEELEFDKGLDIIRAKNYLSKYGAWEDDELRKMSDKDVAKTLLWVVCGDIADGNDNIYLDNNHRFGECGNNPLTEAEDEETSDDSSSEESSSEEEISVDTETEKTSDAEDNDEEISIDAEVEDSTEDSETEETTDTETSSEEEIEPEDEESSDDSASTDEESSGEEISIEDETSSDSEKKDDGETKEEVKKEEEEKEVEKEEKPSDKKELSRDEILKYVEKFVSLWKQTLKNMSKESYNDLEIEEIAEFWKSIGDGWTEKAEMNEFLTDKNKQSLYKLKIEI